MCYERWRTRDRLLKYDKSIIMPLTPRTTEIPMIYPWENLPLSILSEQILGIAQKHGYVGTSEEFWKRFPGGMVVTATLNTFPIPGNESNLYLDIETNILYYFKIIDSDVSDEIANEIGATIVDKHNVENRVETYLYIPIRSMPIENLIYDSGDAAEYID